MTSEFDAFDSPVSTGTYNFRGTERSESPAFTRDIGYYNTMSRTEDSTDKIRIGELKLQNATLRIENADLQKKNVDLFNINREITDTLQKQTAFLEVAREIHIENNEKKNFESKQNFKSDFSFVTGEDILDLDSQIKEFNITLDRQKRQISSLELNNQSLTIKIAQITEETQELLIINTELRSDNAALNALSISNEELEGKIKELKRSLENEKEFNKEMETEIEKNRLQADINEQNQDVIKNKLQWKIRELANTIEQSATTNVENNQKAANTNNETIDKLQIKINMLQVDLEHEQTFAALAQADFLNSKNANVLLETQNHNLITQNDETKLQLQELQTDLINEKANCAAKVSTLEKINTTYKSSENDLADEAEQKRLETSRLKANTQKYFTLYSELLAKSKNEENTDSSMITNLSNFSSLELKMDQIKKKKRELLNVLQVKKEVRANPSLPSITETSILIHPELIANTLLLTENTMQESNEPLKDLKDMLDELQLSRKKFETMCDLILKDLLKLKLEYFLLKKILS